MTLMSEGAMAIPKPPHMAGETTITGKNQVSLPAQSVKELGWKRGDRLIVETLGGDFVMLMRRPSNWTEAFAGRLTHVFGKHDETLRWLDEERDSWNAEGSGDDDEGAG
jgi:bifunctional DNA-binding transcriptional regulator/antitoxin component of YhaV-PrlF toxin-antitoxin module